MHSAGCPTNKSDTTYYTVPLAGLQAEIARLQAELEKAERDRDKLLTEMVHQTESMRVAIETIDTLSAAYESHEMETLNLLTERDEARNALKQDEKEVLAERRRAIKAEKALSAAKLIAWRDRQEYCAQRDEARQWANKLQDKMFDVLVSLYMSSERPYYAVAELCDEKLDRSGALLGRVREEAMKRGGRNG
jgi:chromosome segregation ATPase